MGTGAGKGLNFGNTNGSIELNQPIKKLSDVRYSKKKTEGYLLNPDHPIGAGKAKFMREVLGYEQSDSHLFHKNVVKSIMGIVPSRTEETPFGLKHTFNTKLISKDGESIAANVVVIIQKDNKRTTYKLITVYPDKKGGNKE